MLLWYLPRYVARVTCVWLDNHIISIFQLWIMSLPIPIYQVLSELAPYVELAEKLGRLAVQLVAGGSGIRSVKVVYRSAGTLTTWTPDFCEP